MPMKFGLSMFAALQTPDELLREAIVNSFPSAEIGVWRVWTFWTPTGEQYSLIRPDGSLNSMMLDRLQRFLDLTSQNNLHVQLVGAPNLATNLPTYGASWKTLMQELAPLGPDVWSVDVFNEFDRRIGNDRNQTYTVVAGLAGLSQTYAPGHKVTASCSMPAANGLSQGKRQANEYYELKRDFGCELDYYAGHAQRQPPSTWASQNQTFFVDLRRGLADPEKLVNANPEVWDDEGAREGYEAADNPTVQQRVTAAAGAENAGCAVHIFHTGANFFGGLALSQTEIDAILRIKDEVIDDVGSPPVPPPVPPPEPC